MPWASQLIPANVGEVRNALREEKPAAANESVPRVRTSVHRGRDGRVLDRHPTVALDEDDEDVLAA